MEQERINILSLQAECNLPPSPLYLPMQPRWERREGIWMGEIKTREIRARPVLLLWRDNGLRAEIT